MIKEQTQSNNFRSTPDDKNVIFENAIKCKVLLIPLLKLDGKAPVFEKWNTYKEFDEALMREWQKKYKHIAWGMPTYLFFAVDKDGQNWGKLKPEWLKDLPSQRTKNGQHWLAPHPENKLITKTKIEHSDFDIIGINSNGKHSQIRIYDATLFDQLLNCPPAPPELIKYLRDAKATNPKAKRHSKSSHKEDKFSQSGDKWQKGTRNHNFNKAAFQSVAKGDPLKFAESIYKAFESGYPWGEAKATIQSILNNLPKDQQQKEIQTLINWGVAKVEYKRPKEFLPGIIPNAFSIWMSDTGLGKTTTIINIFTINWLTNTLPGTTLKGNGKPFLYHGPENYIGLIQKRVKDAGGNLNTIEYFIDNRNRPMDVKKRLLNEGIINAIQSKQHGGIVIDRLYETLDDINKDTAKYLDPIREASMEYEVPVIGMCSQKKQKQHQTIIDQVKGDSNIAQTARAVVYLHEGKQLKQRVLVVPKNNLTGDLSKGFLTSMDTDDSPIHFEPIHGHYKSLLEQYAMGFAGMNTIPKKSDRAELIDLIKDRFEELGGDWKWSMNDFKVFLNSNTQKEWNKVGRTRLLKACGLMCDIPKNGTNYFLVKR